ncbi:MAG: hypothetical protein ACTSRE_11555 [Promethearchaeota archaeon]
MKKHDDGFEPFDIKDLDEMLEKLFGNISDLPNLGENAPKTHHHSITYRFGTGMDKPEIRLNGKKVNDEDLQNFMEKMGPNMRLTPTRVSLGSTEGIQELDIKDVSIPDNPDPSAVDYNDTYFEIGHDGEARIVTIELPGVEKDHILLTQNGSTLSIIGENEYTSYKAEFQLDFQHRNIDIDGINGIYQIRITK